MSRKIRIFDTTLRDGEQAPGCGMSIGAKVEMACQLERLGVDVIEAGFPIASPDVFQAVGAISRRVKDSTVCAMARLVEEDIRRAYEAVKAAESPRLLPFIATSGIHMKYKLQMTPAQVLEQTASMVKLARGLCPDIEFGAEDASRSDREFLMRVYNTAVAAGATTLDVTDTVGYATPDEIFDLITYIRAHLENPDVALAIHTHNDLGMGVANALAGIRAGASQVECTVNGIGERAGNAALDEIVMALHTRADSFGCETGINLRQLYRTSKLLTTITGVGVAPNKPVVGANAFAHESGIHQHGVLAEPSTYQIMKPEDIGIYRNRMVLGKHSGRHAFAERISELGYRLTESGVSEAFERFKALADRKKEISDRDIEALVGAAGFTELSETYRLKSFVINSGTVISATAVVRLVRNDGREIEHVARGEGPIDAAFKAIDRIVAMDSKLENWSMQAVTEGEDALGEAICRINCNGRLVTGRGLSPDILEASIKSYINAINKAIAFESKQEDS